MKEGKPENVLTLLLSNNADNRVWKCVECQELVIGSDEMYVAHYTQIHPHLDEPAFACELCAHITSSSADYQVHLHSHISNPLPLVRKRQIKFDLKKKKLLFTSR